MVVWVGEGGLQRPNGCWHFAGKWPVPLDGLLHLLWGSQAKVWTLLEPPVTHRPRRSVPDQSNGRSSPTSTLHHHRLSTPRRTGPHIQYSHGQWAPLHPYSPSLYPLEDPTPLHLHPSSSPPLAPRDRGCEDWFTPGGTHPASLWRCAHHVTHPGGKDAQRSKASENKSWRRTLQEVEEMGVQEEEGGWEYYKASRGPAPVEQPSIPPILSSSFSSCPDVGVGGPPPGLMNIQERTCGNEGHDLWIPNTPSCSYLVSHCRGSSPQLFCRKSNKTQATAPSVKSAFYLSPYFLSPVQLEFSHELN